MIHHGDLKITTENQNDFQELTKVIGKLVIEENCVVNLFNLKKIDYGGLYLKENSTLECPNLTYIGCYIYSNKNAKLIHPLLSGLNYKSVGNSLFVIESEKQIHNHITILQGYAIASIQNNKLDKHPLFVAEKNDFSVYGHTIKNAVDELAIANKLTQ